MILIDTHTHLYLDEFKEDIEKIIENANQNGVNQFYLPAIDSTEVKNQELLEEKFPDQMFLMAGLHPCSVKENYREELLKIEDRLSKRKYAAIGETGLDFHWDTTFKNEQYNSLHIHAEWAIKYGLPLVLHTRNAMRETIDEIKKYIGSGLTGIFHCFSGTKEEAREIIDLGFYLGIGGVLTFKNSGLADVIKDIDLHYIVLETDAPYLAPAPYRGKRNESAYLKIIAEFLANLKNMEVEEVAQTTTKNAKKIFS